VSEKEEGAESDDAEGSDQENSSISEHQEDPSVKIIDVNKEVDKEEAKYYNYTAHVPNSSYKNSFLSHSNSYPVQALEEGFPSLSALDYQFEAEDLEEHNVTKRNHFLREDCFVDFPGDDQENNSDNGNALYHPI